MLRRRLLKFLSCNFVPPVSFSFYDPNKAIISGQKIILIVSEDNNFFLQWVMPSNLLALGFFQSGVYQQMTLKSIWL